MVVERAIWGKFLARMLPGFSQQISLQFLSHPGHVDICGETQGVGNRSFMFLHLGGDWKASPKLGSFHSNAWSGAEGILPPLLISTFVSEVHFYFSSFSWKNRYNQPAGEKGKENKIWSLLHNKKSADDSNPIFVLCCYCWIAGNESSEKSRYWTP